MCGWQVKLCDPSLTRAIPERIWGVSRRCAIQIDIYFTLLTNHDSLSRRSLQQHRGHGRSRHVQAYFPMVSTPVIYVVNSCLYSDIGFLGHIACIARMRPIATNVAHSAVCLSVCLSVCLCVYWSHKCALQKRLNRSTSRLTRVGPRNHVLDAFEIPPREGAILGSCPAHWKHWEFLLRFMKRKESFYRRQRQPTAMLFTGRCRITLREKYTMRPLKIIWPVVVCFTCGQVWHLRSRGCPCASTRLPPCHASPWRRSKV